MPDLVPVKRAILSVSDKADLIPFARALVALGVEIISTGGTAKAISDAGLTVTPIEKLTGFPEMLGGRVKTLHPMVHAGLLAVRDDASHAEAMRKHAIKPIDLVCINLYPFERTISDAGVSESEAIEQIDIGGPSMIRSGSKNFDWVTVITAPSQYDRLVQELNANGGATPRRLRHELAAAAFARTSEYDAAIAAYLSRVSPEAFPQVLRLTYLKADDLRYGENPHQSAAVYRDPASTGPSVVNARKLHGKPLSYNNVNDAAAALELVKALRKLDSSRIGTAVIKHANPCGAAMAATCRDAVDAAIAGDPQAAYGGILAVNRPLDSAAADRLCRDDVFLEVIAAADFEPAAAEALRKRWANVRLLAVGDRAASTRRKLDYRSVAGGMLVQDRDTTVPEPGRWVLAAGPKPTSEQLAAAAFLECVGRSLSSNAIAIGGAAPESRGTLRLFGAGCGQVDRVGACRIAVEKAGRLTRGAIVYSDAFFPFPDGPQLLIDAGAKVIVHPGGSKRDSETFALCEKHAVTCLTTAIRHFRH